jgi:hypothetical protein
MPVSTKLLSLALLYVATRYPVANRVEEARILALARFLPKATSHDVLGIRRYLETDILTENAPWRVAMLEAAALVEDPNHDVNTFISNLCLAPRFVANPTTTELKVAGLRNLLNQYLR